MMMTDGQTVKVFGVPSFFKMVVEIISFIVFIVQNEVSASVVYMDAIRRMPLFYTDGYTISTMHYLCFVSKILQKMVRQISILQSELANVLENFAKLHFVICE